MRSPAPSSARDTLALVAIVVLGALLRCLAVGATSPERLQPDEAHALNVARCFARGQGFSTTEAWPAWLAPAKLPTPETFKEPGYPWLIARLTPAGGDLQRTGQMLSLVAGILLPWLLYGLARRSDADPAVARLAALLAATSPLLIDLSVWVLVESLFAAVVVAMLWAASPHADTTRSRPLASDLLAAALFAIAYLLRAQVLLTLPALLWLLFQRRPWVATVKRLVPGAVIALAILSPLIVRNLRLFGVPFFSNIAAYGIWPYVDQVRFSHGLDRPPAPLAFALTHLPAVARHWCWSAIQFLRVSLPGDVLGSALWAVAFAAGVVLALARPREYGFALLAIAVMLGFIFAVHWADYYFSSVTPLICLIAGLGGMWLWRLLEDEPILGPVRGGHLLAAGAALLIVLQGAIAWRQAERIDSPELVAARHEASWLRARLPADASVMVLTTSWWSWYADRPTVHLVIADRERFAEVVKRLEVRYAALPTSQIAKLAAHYPEGRLPDLLVVDHVDSARDLTVFAVRGR